MKLNGTTGKTSRTLIAHAVFGAAQAALGMLQILQGLMTPETYVVVVMAITGVHSAIGWWLRTKTTTPLQ